MDRIPKSLAVIGGGVIGCEYASISRRWELTSRSSTAATDFSPFSTTKSPIAFATGLLPLECISCLTSGRSKPRIPRLVWRLTMKSGNVLETDAALFAAGRGAAVDGLASRKKRAWRSMIAGISQSTSTIERLSRIFMRPATVIGFPALASTSMEQGRVAACHAFGLKYKERVASLLPMGIYTIPEISAAGETEEILQGKEN